MRNKVVEVEPFNFTYRVFNKTEREYHGEFARLIDAVDFIEARFQRIRWSQPAISFTLKKEAVFRYENHLGFLWDTGAKWRRPRVEYHYADATPWVILTEGGVVEQAEVEAAKRERSRGRWNCGWEAREARYTARGVRLTRKKGSGDKIKADWEQVPSSWRHGGYTNLARGYHRSPQTTREIRINTGHVDEYGEGIVRGRRRCLPSTYDDRPISAWKSEDSWKHHSKRRKQWKPK